VLTLTSLFVIEVTGRLTAHGRADERREAATREASTRDE
jgi:hypothetical protein